MVTRLNWRQMQGIGSSERTSEASGGDADVEQVKLT
jgi:hypothetical protein